MVTGPGHGLAFQLAAAGYDVWMGNFRGNTYSKGHIRDISDKEYWVLSIQVLARRSLSCSDLHLGRARRVRPPRHAGTRAGGRPEYLA